MYISIGTLVKLSLEMDTEQEKPLIVGPQGSSLGEEEKTRLERFKIIAIEVDNIESFPLRLTVFKDLLTLEPSKGGAISIFEKQPDLPSRIVMTRNRERGSVTFVDNADGLLIYENPIG